MRWRLNSSPTYYRLPVVRLERKCNLKQCKTAAPGCGKNNRFERPPRRNIMATLSAASRYHAHDAEEQTSGCPLRTRLLQGWPTGYRKPTDRPSRVLRKAGLADRAGIR